jgi:hypothetical protein
MGTNPNREKMPNRGMGRPIGEDDEPPKDVNVQEISYDSTTNNQPGGGSNFKHGRKGKED